MTEPIRFDTKIAVLLRDDLATWQRLNVTAFLVSGIATPSRSWSARRTATRTAPGTCRCSASRCWSSRDRAMLVGAHARALVPRRCRSRSSRPTCSPPATTGTTARRSGGRRETLDLVGLAVHGPRNAVDKVLKGASMHP